MIYISSSCVKKYNIADVIQELAENGITNIELSGGTDYYKNIEQDLIRLKNLYHLTYVCHAYFPPPEIPFVVNLASCNDKIYQQSINHYVYCIEMLKHIGCKALSVHAGFLIEAGIDEIGKKLSSKTVYDEDRAYDRFYSAFKYIDRLCLESGIELFLENNVLSVENYQEFDGHNYMMMTDYASIMKMRKVLNFNLLLDLGHLYVSSKTLNLDYARECNELKEHVKWIHISENNGCFDEHKPLKQDSEIMREFCKMYNPCRNVTLETVGNIDEIVASNELIKCFCGFDS